MALTREQAQFLLIFLCVPVQYFVSQYMGSNEVSRSYEISKFVGQLKSFQRNWLEADPWRKWCSAIIMDVLSRHGKFSSYPPKSSSELNGESPAFEVLKYRERDGHFANSAEIRNPRSPTVKYRVGQVIKHKLWGYHGVIIGWDETARAPEEWLKQMHGDHASWRSQPNYSILVDTRDRSVPQVTYVPQENLEVVKQVKIIHPSTEEFFENFDGSQYLPRPWLKGLYPRD